MATKQTTDLYIKIGVIIGAYFLILKPILEKLGIQKTVEEEKTIVETKKAATTLESPFSPRYWKSFKKPFILTNAAAESFVKKLYDSVSGSLFGDDLNTIYGVFRQLKYKTQVSYLAQYFFNKYKVDLVETLKNGTKYSNLINFRAGLNDEEMQTIYDIVKNLK